MQDERVKEGDYIYIYATGCCCVEGGRSSCDWMRVVVSVRQYVSTSVRQYEGAHRGACGVGLAALNGWAPDAAPRLLAVLGAQAAVVQPVTGQTLQLTMTTRASLRITITITVTITIPITITIPLLLLLLFLLLREAGVGVARGGEGSPVLRHRGRELQLRACQLEVVVEDEGDLGAVEGP